jgi:hypothetical protein
MIRNVEVAQVNIQGMVGYQVQCLYMDSSDGMFECIAHAAVFRTAKRAEAMKQRILSKATWSWDWSVWGRPVGTYFSVCDAIQAHVAAFSVLPAPVELRPADPVYFD